MFRLLKMACMMVFAVLWGILWTAEDEMVEIENSIREGAFKMSYSAYELLSKESGAFVEIGESGSVIVGTAQQGSITLSAQEAYSLLDILYRHVDVLRQREDTMSLQELPAWAQPEEQVEQWRASGTCQVDPRHTGRDVFRCDGCQKMCCNECGDTMEDVWLCESCLAQENVAYPF